MTDEERIETEKTGDEESEVEGHRRRALANDEGKKEEDESDEVEAHMRRASKHTNL